MCKDVNECVEGSHRCSQNCSNTDGSYECSCMDGYQLNSNGYSCNGMITVVKPLILVLTPLLMYIVRHNTSTTTEPVSAVHSPSAFELASIAGVAIILLLLIVVVICIVTYFILRRKRKYELKTVK